MSFLKDSDSGEVRYTASLGDVMPLARVVLYNLDEGHEQYTIMFEGETANTVKGMVMSLHLVAIDGHSLLLGCGYENGSIELTMVDVASKRHSSVGYARCHNDPVFALGIDTAFRTVYSAGGDNKLCVSNYMAGDQAQLVPDTERTVVLTNNGVSRLDLLPGGKVIAVAGWDFRVRLFSTESLAPVRVLMFHRAPIMFIDHSHDTGSEATPPGYLPRAVATRWTRRPRWLAVASQDSRISLWELEDYD
ncbi:Guanine nucleotide binding protein (G protein), beta polypeptide 1-like [Spiromyces aspiralis]|uniref:Guanine nucleotide binding protein (G protein), beta polypeptide 1-like n=1 Tax=Spiromyces aspiralis TaxID=68401 RepID=A0ACC1HFI9_9FUNG|nr:Guanine nucleotide binding protein (G protein), beta polypeptide 1-like [Spiromyces aspiralis]